MKDTNKIVYYNFKRLNGISSSGGPAGGMTSFAQTDNLEIQQFNSLFLEPLLQFPQFQNLITKHRCLLKLQLLG